MKPPMVEKGLKAGDLIKEISQYIKGGGGGRPDMAQAGGSYPEGLDQAIEAASQWIQEQL